MNSTNWINKKITKIVGITTGVLIVLAILLYSTIVYTSQPNFCSTCHYMEPYVEGWKSSTHSEVTCTDCHFPPGLKSKLKGKFTAMSMTVNYFTGVYKKSKPWAEISDKSCLRPGCHQERLLEGKVSFKEDIIFDHKPHLTKLRREKKLRCTSCHSQIVQGEHISVTESTCFLCHFKNQPEEASIDNCTWCHDAPIPTNGFDKKYDHSFVVEHNIECQKCHGKMQVGDGVVPVERCSSCHADIEKIEKYDDVVYMHKNHVTDHKIECQNCHLTIQHKSVSKTVDILPGCQSCHENSHQSQLSLFSGTGGKQVPSHPNPMYEDGLNCQACHIFHQPVSGIDEFGQTDVAKGESCERCHGQGYSKIFEQWENVMAEKIDLLDNAFKIVNKEVNTSGLSKDLIQRASQLVEDAQYNFQLVKQGNVVHNVAYSDELLLVANIDLKKALNLIGSTSKIPDLTVFSKLVPSECKNCHYGQEEIDVNVFGIDFSHNIHIVKNRLLCSKCHSNMQQHGDLIVSRNDCLSCHHKPDEEHCEKCHNIQEQIYSGTIAFADEEMPDVMFDEDVECRSCHESDYKVIRKASGATCVQCHDEDYEELFGEWQDETKQLINEISDILSSVDYLDLSHAYQLKIDEIGIGLDKIKKDKSFGAHNIELISTTLNKYREILNEISQK